MEHWAPVIQTILWVALLGFISWRYHPHVDRLLEALQKRIDGGAGVTLGPVTLGELKPQSQAAQLDAAQLELKQLSLAKEPKRSADDIYKLSPTNAPIIFEDIALRALQIDYNAAISRQIAVGRYLIDGLAVINQSTYIFDIKFASGSNFDPRRLKIPLDKIQQAVESSKWGNPRIVFCIVYGEPVPDIDQERGAHMDYTRKNTSIYVEFTYYQASELLERFNLQTSISVG